MHEIVIALLTGNAVVFKTSTHTQMVGRKIEECARAAELPDGLFHYVNMPGSEAGNAFLELGVNKLFFTGSVAVGKILMGKAAETLTPVSLELGGNDAMIVDETADIDRATGGAIWAGLINAGQSCGGVERIYVHNAVYDRFLTTIKPKIEALRIGIDTDFSCEIGSMTTARQAQTVHEHLKDALEKGAAIYAQASFPDNLSPDRFIPPTLLIDVEQEMRLMREETFGPVMGVMPFRDIDQAIALANDSDLGLTASIWSKKPANIRKLSQYIQAGAITINDHLMSHGMAETPWGGYKQSGIGRTHGSLGFEEMTQPKVVVRDRLSFTKRALWWYPYSESLYRNLLGLLDLLYGKTLRSRLSGVRKALKLVPRIFRSWDGE